MLPKSVVRDSTIQVRPIGVIWEVSIDSLQQQVHTFECKVRQICALFSGGNALTGSYRF